jgi:hypothetical protein
MRRLLLFVIPLLALAVGTIYGGWAFQRIRFPFDGSVPGLESPALRNLVPWRVRNKPVDKRAWSCMKPTQLGRG